MCHDNHRCLDALLTATDLGELPRDLQATQIGISRSQLLASLNGPVAEYTATRIARRLELPTEAIVEASTVARCTRRRAKRPRSAYGERIVELTAQRGWTMDDLQESSGVDRTTLYHTLGEGVTPSLEVLLKIGTAFDVDPVELAKLTGECLEHPLDYERVRAGMTRSQYAREKKMTVAVLFGMRRPRNAAEAYRLQLLLDGDEDAAERAALATAGGTPSCLGDFVRRWLAVNNTSTTALAAKVEVSRQSLVAWICGVSSPSSPTLQRLASATGLDPVELAKAVRTDRISVRERVCDAGLDLRGERRRYGLSRVDLANQLGVSVLRVRLAESGHLPVIEVNQMLAMLRGETPPL